MRHRDRRCRCRWCRAARARPARRRSVARRCRSSSPARRASSCSTCRLVGARSCAMTLRGVTRSAIPSEFGSAAQYARRGPAAMPAGTGFSASGSSIAASLKRNFRGGAAPTRGCASPRGTSRRCGGRYRRRRVCSNSTIRSSDSVVVRRLAVDQAADAEAHRLGRMRVAAARGGDRRGEEIFQLEEAARRRHVLVGGDPADRALVHADRVGDVAQDQRPQRLHAVAEEPVLLARRSRSRP